ncbi:MAG: protoheme IX farnesyltransferase [Fuerstiella sp.]|nr:protoheme IX farnesyltransferase [Fuerstiella sp.]MCP4507816.1 protoheme IX farnesyltransferase [Fuerstiella sp.]MCP4782266.1 protoheme IX farnesyltransferase [Fuerstiella sp.]MCP4856223.1 protoheme IX farnesyltransferase [Fuerstiella sp.]
MSIAPSASQPSTPVSADSLRVQTGVVIGRQRLADYAELCRPRIAVMTMVAVAVGFTLASPITFDGAKLVVAMLGVVQLVAASSILNQCLERRTDVRMTRTQSRPIASGRISVSEASAAAALLTVVGFCLLWNIVNPAAAIATLATLVAYALAYTLLKTRTSLCTTIGAIPGAMPPVIGWLAAGRGLGVEALALFAIFFVWQFPHFLAIGWIHRRDYQHAGLRMLPSFTDNGFLTGLIAVIYAAAFVPVSAFPAYIGMSGDLYLVSAMVFSVAYLVYSIRFLMRRSEVRARSLLYNSLICLPLLLIALVLDFLRLTAIG